MTHPKLYNYVYNHCYESNKIIEQTKQCQLLGPQYWHVSCLCSRLYHPQNHIFRATLPPLIFDFRNLENFWENSRFCDLVTKIRISEHPAPLPHWKFINDFFFQLARNMWEIWRNMLHWELQIEVQVVVYSFLPI